MSIIHLFLFIYFLIFAAPAVRPLTNLIILYTFQCHFKWFLYQLFDQSSACWCHRDDCSRRINVYTHSQLHGVIIYTAVAESTRTWFYRLLCGCSALSCLQAGSSLYSADVMCCSEWAPVFRCQCDNWMNVSAQRYRNRDAESLRRLNSEQKFQGCRLLKVFFFLLEPVC